MFGKTPSEDFQEVKFKDGTTSPISFGSLRKFNFIMGIAHFVQATLMLIVGFTVDAFTDFPLQISILQIDYPRIELGEAFELTNYGPILAAFLYLSALAHLLVSGPLYNWYKKNLTKKMNPIRWFEYALSSSVMIFFIASLFAIKEVWILFLMFVVNALMNLFGHVMEIINQYTEKTNWVAYIYGWIAGIAPWVVIASIFGSVAGEAPWFVTVIFIVELILFMSFAFNMLLQYLKIGPWKDYMFGERMYIILSLVAKTLLAWLVFAGVLQPGETVPTV